MSQSSQSAPLLFGEAGDLEANAPLAIATFWPGNYAPYVAGDNGADVAKLSGSLSAGATTVRVKSAASVRPSGEAATWPYRSSRGAGTAAGAHTVNTHDVVSFVRVDDELMQITGNPSVDGGDVVLAVRRGIWGTQATSHAANARVMSPVYIGSKTAVADDQGLSGIPGRDDSRYALRYGIKLWQPDGYGWIADRIRDTFGSGFQGYNAFWLDVTSCVQYNNADWAGNPVWGWDDPVNKKLTRDRWGDHQQTKLAGLRSELPGKKMVTNTLQNNDSCADELLASHTDAGVMENWMRTDGSWGNGFSWTAEMDRTIRTMANNWPAAYWVRWNRGVPDPQRYERFAYGSLLLAHRPSATKYTYGGPFDLDRPDELYFWDWGTPSETTSQVSGLALPSGLYARAYSNGLIIVNPTSTTKTHNLGGTYYDVVNKNPQGDPTPVTTITIPAKDAAFLVGNVTAGDPPPKCDGKTATIVGTNGPNTLTGTSGPDVIWGGGGNDTIKGLAGNDTICGGGGKDVIFGAGGNDTILGGKGNDTIWASDGSDTVSGGKGNDAIWPGGGTNESRGNGGDDAIHATFGNNDSYGGNNNDVIYVAAGSGEVSGGKGIDTIDARDATSRVEIDIANPDGKGGTFSTTQGSAVLFGIEHAVGSAFGDELLGDFRNNVLTGRGGPDTIRGFAGNDALYGSSGNDYLNGGSGADQNYGGAGTGDECTNGTPHDCESGGGGGGGACTPDSAPYGIGEKTVTLVDPSRGRTLQTTIYYPATSNGTNAPVVCGPFPMVVAGHGAAGNGRSAADLFRFLVNDGYVVVGPTFPSGFQFDQMARDVSFVIDEVLDMRSGNDPMTQFDGQNIGFIGTSLGGGVGYSLFLNCCTDSRVDAVLPRAGVVPTGSFNYNNGPALLAIHGDADTVVPIAPALSFYNSAQSPKGFIRLAGVGHDLNVGPHPLLRDVALGFFDWQLRGDTGGKNVILQSVNSLGLATIQHDW